MFSRKNIRTWNSFYGSRELVANSGYSPLTYQECKRLKDKLGINECYRYDTDERDDDYRDGTVKNTNVISSVSTTVITQILKMTIRQALF